MQPNQTPASAAARQHGFSLVEILVTVGLLTFIVLGLLAMFNQTQRAFKSSITQTDVLEAGRATMALITRDLEQLCPTHCPDFWQSSGYPLRATNFFAEVSASFSAPLQQDLPGSSLKRVNEVQRFFMISKDNQDWIGTGYQVIPEYIGAGVGTLYRFSQMNCCREGPMTVSQDFLRASITNMARLAEGIVQFSVRAFATNGYVITTNVFTTPTNGFAIAPPAPGLPPVYARVQHTIITVSPYAQEQSGCYFMSNAVPAYVEIELGILEPQILQRYRAIGNTTPALQTAQRDFLAEQASRVHLFRQRVPIRSVDISAYK